MKPKHKRILLGFHAVVAGLSAVALAGCKTVHVETTIAARPATVWKVLSDAQSYHEWNPVHVRVEGRYEQGTEVQVHLKDRTGKLRVFPAEVRRVLPEQELNQGGGMPGLFTFNHTFLLKAVEGGTLLTQHEEFRGIGVPFWGDWVDEEAYTRVNMAAKQRAEALEKTGE